MSDDKSKKEEVEKWEVTVTSKTGDVKVETLTGSPNELAGRLSDIKNSSHVKDVHARKA